jgi:hypothetical protein
VLDMEKRTSTAVMDDDEGMEQAWMVVHTGGVQGNSQYPMTLHETRWCSAMAEH